MNEIKSPLVSVVIPTYNRENTIINCLNSVLQQTYNNIEVIIVDDCSTDNTEELVKHIHDSRIRYYKLEKNRRACFARNFGARKAQGQYIAFQDSDDIWKAEKLSKEMMCLLSSDKDMVFCGMNRISGNNSSYFPTQTNIDTNNNFFAQELEWNAVSTQTILLKKEVMQTVEFDESLKKYQDWDFAIRVAQHFKVGYLDEALVDSYLQENSISVTVTHFDSIMVIFNKYYEEIVKYPAIEARYYRHFGDCFRKTDSKRAKDFYLKSLKVKFNAKVLEKYLISVLGVKR